MGVFNSDDHYIYYCGQESLRRNGVALIVKESEMQKQEVKKYLEYQGNLALEYKMKQGKD